MFDQITVKIDGKEVTVPKGTYIVEAAKKVGVEIPVFCYHNKLDSVGMCRVCLVEVGTPAFDRATRQPVLDDDGNPVVRFFPKPMPACYTEVSQGMEVKVDSEAAVDDRKAVLEFLLTSHPLDCPICDKGGECPLQDLTMEHGPGISRFNYEDKQHFPKKYPLGDLIYLDMERCVICSRCIRFQDEIAHDPVLGFEERGRYSHIVSYSNPEFDSHYSGNTTDICPVGALTTRDFRFGARAWELTNVPSVCNHCGVGCNTVLSTRTGEVKRIMPRQNELVNEVWICDKGRFAHHFNGSPNRLQTPLIKKNGEFVEASWSEALELIANKFGAIKDEHGADALGGIASARLSNEDLYLFQKLFRQVIGTNNVDYRVGLNALLNDETANTVGIGCDTNLGEIATGSTILVIGSDLDHEAPITYLRVAGASTKRGAHVINAGGRKTKLDAQAQTSLRYNYGTAAHLVWSMVYTIIREKLVDETFVENNVEGFDEIAEFAKNYTATSVAKITGVPSKEIRAAAMAYAEAENGIILFGLEASGDPALQAGIEALAALTGHAGKPNNGVIAVLPDANSRGATDMGVVPHLLPGYQPANGEAGKSASEMLNGGVKAMLIAGVDPALDGEQAKQALKNIDFLVVQDLFETDTAKYADVILPAKAVAERDGTFTNIERRVQAFDTGVPSPMLAWPDWLIVTAIAGQMGADWAYASADGVMAEITETVPLYQEMGFENVTAPVSLDRQTTHYIYEGMSFTGEVREGVQWRTVAEQADRKITLQAVEPTDPQAGEGFTLVAPRVLYDSDRLVAESEVLESRFVKPQVLLSRDDAGKIGVNTGDQVTVSQNGTSLFLPVMIDRKLHAGTVIVPRNVEGRPAEKLIGAEAMFTTVKIEK